MYRSDQLKTTHTNSVFGPFNDEVMFMAYQKPRLPVAQDEDPDPVSPMALPKPPSDPLELKRGAVGARARLFRAGSLTALPPVARPTEGKERWRERKEMKSEEKEG